MDMMVALGHQAVLDLVERLEIKEQLVTLVALEVQGHPAHTDLLDLGYVISMNCVELMTILNILCMCIDRYMHVYR